MLLGLASARAGGQALASAFLLVGHIALIAVCVRSVRTTRDYLNPIFLLVVLGLVRFSIPAWMVSLGLQHRIPLLDFMGLTEANWRLGHVLAVLALLALALGWLLVPAATNGGSPSLRLSRGALDAGLVGMALGLAFLVVFVGANVTSLGATIVEGSFRATTIREGTGPFFHLSLMLISSSVIVSAYLVGRGLPWYAAGLPALISSLAFLVLGGRVRAVTPLLVAILLLWYRRKDRSNWPAPRLSTLLKGLAIGVPSALLVTVIGQDYRNKGLSPAVLSSLVSPTELRGMLEYTMLIDIGSLHALAGSALLGPGTLAGQTFTILIWPISQVLALPSRSAGVYLVEATSGLYGRKWGIHATLPGDSYLNFGLYGLVVSCLVLGLLIRWAYRGFRSGKLHGALYGVIAVYSFRIFLETIEKWPEMWLVGGYTFAIIVAGSVMGAAARARPTPEVSLPAPASNGVPSGRPVRGTPALSGAESGPGG